MERNAGAAAGQREMDVLRKYFPQCFSADGEFDIEAFKAALPGGTTLTDETSGFNWLGKNYARMLTNMDTTTLIRPDEEHNAKPENRNSNNVYISGDNLDALQHLVKSYGGKVKVIYIDPPYNTGTDGFVYNDKFNFTADELALRLDISPERAARILNMTRRGSASHAAWLTFMLPRLSFARDLLTDDGVIFISIDDNEQANLKNLCDEVFGEDNFLANLTRRTKVGGGSASNYFAVEHDYVLVYAKDVEKLPNLFVPFDKDYLKRYAFEDEIGKYFWDTMERSSTATKPYLIEAPDGTMLEGKWFRSKDRFLKDKKNGEIRFLKKENGSWAVQFKQRIAQGKKIRSILGENEFKSHQDDLEKLGMANLFSYPKTVFLVKYLIQSVLKPNDICLDAFSGSATTAHSVMQLASEFSGDLPLKYVMIQLPENLDESLKTASGERKELLIRDIEFLEKCGYPHTLDYLGFERIKRAAKKIKEANPLFSGDLGFKHYTLEEPKQDALLLMEQFDPISNNITDFSVDDFGLETVLRTWLVADGYGLTEDAEEVLLGRYKAYWKGDHLYLINRDNDFDASSIAALMDKYNGEQFSPHNIVIFGYSFDFTHREELQKNLRTLKEGNKTLTVNLDVRY